MKVVILGLYPDPRAAASDGLAFSHLPHVDKPSPTLRAIHSELVRDIRCPKPRLLSLRPWAERGVLLLNTTLTCDEGKPASHAKVGWWKLVIETVCHLNRYHTGLVFMLWGKAAQEYAPLIDTKKHLVLKCDFPSAKKLGRRPFRGSKHFSKANEFLGERKIDWKLV